MAKRGVRQLPPPTRAENERIRELLGAEAEARMAAEVRVDLSAKASATRRAEERERLAVAFEVRQARRYREGVTRG